MLINRTLVFVLLTVSIISTSAQAQNLLSNPGFETGDFTSWTAVNNGGVFGVGQDGDLLAGVSAAFFGTGTVSVRSGTFAAYTVVASSAGEFLSLAQTVNLTAGTYQAGFWMDMEATGSACGFGLLNSGTGALFTGRIGIYVDGQQITWDGGVSFFSLSSYREFFGEFVSAGGNTLIEFRMSCSGNARAGLSGDDFYVMAATEGPGAFSINNTVVNEGDGTATLSVSRAGGAAGAVSVNFATVDGTAEDENGSGDYTAQNNTLNWADADSADKNIVIAITDDVEVESDELFTVTLSGATGGATITDGSGSVTIQDNDEEEPTTIEPIPTMSEWALIVLAMLIGLVGIAGIRRRQ